MCPLLNINGERINWKIITSTLLNFGLVASLFFTNDSFAETHTNKQPNAAYVQECGSCHAPFPAKGLSASSWQAVLDGMDKHFGSDASVEPKLLTEINNYLIQNARSKDTLVDGKPALRITETSWFLHEHKRVLDRTLALPQVKTASNCAACHTNANQGRYSEHDIHVPKPGEIP